MPLEDTQGVRGPGVPRGWSTACQGGKANSFALLLRRSPGDRGEALPALGEQILARPIPAQGGEVRLERKDDRVILSTHLGHWLPRQPVSGKLHPGCHTAATEKHQAVNSECISRDLIFGFQCLGLQSSAAPSGNQGKLPQAHKASSWGKK